MIPSRAAILRIRSMYPPAVAHMVRLTRRRVSKREKWWCVTAPFMDARGVWHTVVLECGRSRRITLSNAYVIRLWNMPDGWKRGDVMAMPPAR